MTAPRSVTVGHPNAARTAILFPGIASCISEVEVIRARVLAQEWDARVTLVDTPGFGVDGAHLTRREIVALLRGDFGPVAQRMLDAALTAGGARTDRAVLLVGYSLGCSVAARAATDPRLRVERLVLVEPAAIEPRNPLALGISARIDDWGTVPDPLPPDVHRRRLDLAVLGIGLSRGRLVDVIERAGRSVPVDLVHARSSRTVDGAALARAHRRLRAAGVAATLTTVPGRHGVWNDTTARASIARLVREGWGSR